MRSRPASKTALSAAISLGLWFSQPLRLGSESWRECSRLESKAAQELPERRTRATSRAPSPAPPRYAGRTDRYIASILARGSTSGAVRRIRCESVESRP